MWRMPESNAIRRYKLAVLSIAAIAWVASAPTAFPQSFPTKPVRIIAEYGAGTGGDLLLRVMLPYAAANLGQPVVLENRDGAGGVRAAEAVKNALPDGYTILAASQNALIVRRFLSKTISVDVFKDLVPITTVSKSTTIVLSNESLPVKSLAELIGYAKANPGKLSYGTSGIGTSHHFSGEEIQQLTGIKMVHVSYKSGVGSMQAVMTGEVHLAIGLAASAVPAMRSGKVNVLALVEGKCFGTMPDVPAVSDVIRGFEPPPSWTGLFAPAGVPQPVLRSLTAAFVKALQSPELRGGKGTDGFELVGNSPQEFAAQLKKDYNLIGRITKAANIQPAD